VQLSPDTRPDGYNDWDGCGGYHYSDPIIYGFSHTHLSGTGVADLCDVLLMPMTDTASLRPSDYRSHFSHEREQAHAGYYRVHLDDPDVEVELTATAHAGMHRYQFPPGRKAISCSTWSTATSSSAPPSIPGNRRKSPASAQPFLGR
jgi:putative alpha-1,2-mannosidase